MQKIYFFLLTCMGASLWANDDYALDSVVVTGTKTQKLQSQVPIKTEVISEQTIEQNHGNSLQKLLTLIPGLNIQRSHGKEGFEVWMQGFDSDRVLVLIDGRVPIATTGATVDLSQIALIDIQRIEIVKGATSALYGSSAMGGVINIITKKSQDGLHAKLETTTGSYLDKAVDSKLKSSLGALVGDSSTNYEWRVNATYKFDPGLAYDEGGFHQDTQESTYQNIGLYGAYKDGKNKFFVALDHFSEDKYHPTQSIQPGLGLRGYERIEDVSAITYSLGAEYFIGDNKFTLDLSQQEYENSSTAEKVATSWRDDLRETTIDKTRLELQFDQLTTNHMISYGVVAQKEEVGQTKTKQSSPTEIIVSQELVGDPTRESLEAYIQDDWFWSEDLEIVSGIRVQNEDSFGTHATPKINLSYGGFSTDFMSVKLRAGVGAGYRAPTVKELYYEFDQSHHGYKVLGNETLEPEESTSVQLGAEFAFAQGIYVDLYLYSNKVTNLIATAPDPELSTQTGLNISRYQNISKASMEGLEISYRAAFLMFHYNGGYTYLKAKNDNTGLSLIKRAEHQLTNTLTYNGDLFSGVITLNYQSDAWADEENTQRSPAYFSSDLRLTKELSDQYILLFGVENITDMHSDQGDVYDLRPKDGRFVYAGVRIKY